MIYYNIPTLYLVISVVVAFLGALRRSAVGKISERITVRFYSVRETTPYRYIIYNKKYIQMI